MASDEELGRAIGGGYLAARLIDLLVLKGLISREEAVHLAQDAMRDSGGAMGGPEGGALGAFLTGLASKFGADRL